MWGITMKKIILGLVGALALSGCGADVTAGEQAVTAFHQQLNAGQYDAITHATGPLLPAATLLPILTMVHTQLGNVTASDRTGVNTAINNGVHTVSLTYNTTFQHGTGTESFVLNVADGHATLNGYGVDTHATGTPAAPAAPAGDNAAAPAETDAAPADAGSDNAAQ